MKEEYAELSHAITQAGALRQAIAAKQHPEGQESSQLWSGPAANPLARLHIIILEEEGREIKGSESLKVSNLKMLISHCS